jgi:hypothetical protein
MRACVRARARVCVCVFENKENTLVFLRSVFHLLVTADVLSSLILSNLMMETKVSSETLVLTRATRRHIPEEFILHSYSLQNLKSYIELTG